MHAVTWVVRALQFENSSFSRRLPGGVRLSKRRNLAADALGLGTFVTRGRQRKIF